MIYYLNGKITIRDKDYVVVDVGGVGYRVFISSEEEYLLNEKTTLYCYMQKTEKENKLFGFRERENLKLFENLTKISGIGPKTALRIASIASVDEIKKGIEREDKMIMKKIFSIGKKKGQQVVFELSEKIIKEIKEDDAFVILKNLGFCDEKIHEALNNVSNTKDDEERVKEALKMLGDNSSKK